MLHKVRIYGLLCEISYVRICIFRSAFSPPIINNKYHTHGGCTRIRRKWDGNWYEAFSEFSLTLLCTFQSRQFKDNFCSDVHIEFVGVFDTISSIGFLGRRLPFTGTNYGIKYFRHAMVGRLEEFQLCSEFDIMWPVCRL